MRGPKFPTARNILKQPWERSFALQLIQSFIATVTGIIERPLGVCIVVLETRFGTGEASRALEGCGGLAGAVTGGDELRENRVDIVSVGVHAVPEHEDHTETEDRYCA
jgi:hypothetical protein